MSETIKIFGTDYPVVKKLTGGWVVAQHPNGLALMKRFAGDDDHCFMGSLLRADLPIPEDVRQAALACVLEQHHRLLRFAGEILARHRGDDPHDIGDVDGGTIQEMAVKHGLLEARRVTAPCGDCCVCAEEGDFPRECYFYSTLGEQALAVK